MDNRSVIIEKIRKLMIKAADTTDGAEAERDIAMQMVSKLLVKYRIDMSEVQTVDEQTIKKYRVFSNFPWTRTIVNAISKMNFCSAYYVPTKPTYAEFHFIGNEHEIDATISLCEMIIKSISKEARTKSKLRPFDKSYKRSFENAAGFRISSRANQIITKMIEEEKKEGTGKDLIIINQYEQAKIKYEEYKINNKVETKTVKPRTVNCSSYAGVIDGKNYANTVRIS